MQSFPGFDEYFYNTLTNFKKKSKKPLIVITPPLKAETGAIEMKRSLLTKGIVSFPGFSRGAEALRKVVEYYSHHD
ncbi:MAG: hypothetical protein SVY10_01180 [Thermodesulfobacteriota bacterium]|nr:hypothetical protein [Thermodesulfobacteriota bacterium]